jgi:hypothetical protein
LKHEFISLGAACDVAMMLDYLGIRKKSLPFDWLWNLYSGLDFVSDNICNNFKNILSINCYVESKHYRFKDPSVVYKKYPLVAHIHTNPLIDLAEHEKLKRRIRRFNNELSSNSFIHFVFYRIYEEDIRSGKSVDLNGTIFSLIDEGKRFVDKLKKQFPDIRFNLLLVVQTPSSLFDETLQIINAETGKNSFDDYKEIINFGQTIPRKDDDKNLLTIWRRQWKKALLNKTNIPTSLKLKISVFSVVKRFVDIAATIIKRINQRKKGAHQAA